MIEEVPVAVLVHADGEHGAERSRDSEPRQHVGVGIEVAVAVEVVGVLPGLQAGIGRPRGALAARLHQLGAEQRIGGVAFLHEVAIPRVAPADLEGRSAARSCSTPTSVPASHSVVISGFRSGFPRLFGASPGPRTEASGEYVVSLSNAPGCRPDWPTATRRRKVENREVIPELPQLGIEVGTKEMPALG